METSFEGKKVKGTISSKAQLESVDVIVQAVFRQETKFNEGAETERLLGQDHKVGTMQIRITPADVADISKVDLKDLLDKAIAEAKTKLGIE